MAIFDINLNLNKLPKNILIGLTKVGSPIRLETLNQAREIKGIEYVLSLILIEDHSEDAQYNCILFNSIGNLINVKTDNFICSKIEYTVYSYSNTRYSSYNFGCFIIYVIDKSGIFRKIYFRGHHTNYPNTDTLFQLYDDLSSVSTWEEYDELLIKKKEEAESIERESIEWQEQDKERRMSDAKGLISNISQIMNFIAEKYDLTKEEILKML